MELLTGSDGRLSIVVTENGNYFVLARQADGISRTVIERQYQRMLRLMGDNVRS